MRLSEAERRSYEVDGYLIREKVFSVDEIDSLRQATEEVCLDLAAAAGPNRIRVYTYQPAGLRTQRENVRRWAGATGASR